jgi:gamma-glutamyl-gamma-aminobutyrate hydrolase PuuD
MSSWERGYGDMAMIPDFTTLRIAPWLESTALVTADLQWLDGAPVEASPRRILQRQLERLAERGLTAHVGTELEFIVFDDSYRDAWRKGYRELTPASDYNIDYALLASTRMEPLLRDIRNAMDGAGMYCEGVKGECNFGQQEIAFRYDTALTTCDNHSIYKNGAKEIADRHGKSLTYMAKFDEREGNSCHIHISLRGEGGSAVFSDADAPHGMSKLFRHFLAGQLAAMRELTLFSAPNVNSYKRYVAGSFAPTAIAWGSTTARAPARGGPRPRHARREPGARRRREPVPRRRGPHRRGPARHRTRARARRPVRGQRVRERLSRACRRPCASPPACSRSRPWRARPSATRSSSTTSTTPASSSRPSTRPSPTGSACVASNDSETTSGRGDGADAPVLPVPAASAPLIGVTTYLEQARSGVWDVPASFLPKAYLDAVTDAGGIAVLLPPQPVSPAIARTLLASLDGLIVAGGADVDPARYGQEPHPRTGAPRTDRDAWEDALLTEAIAAELPFLGICRGAQVLNVALGGTLVQHLPDVVGSERYQPSPAVFGAGAVTVEPGSRLSAVLGDDARNAARALLPPPRRSTWWPRASRVTARSEDGVIEASSSSRCRSASACSGIPRRTPRPPPVRGARRGRPHASHEKEHRVSHTIVNPADEQVVATVTSATIEEADAAIARASAAQGDWAALARSIGHGRCGASPRRSTAPWRTSRPSRCATRGIRSRRPAGRPATCATCSSTTRPRPSGCSAGRSRSPAAWT